jgi:acyl-CoA hydrolase
MDAHRLVLPGHLNQYGFLFGGQLLGWIDEACWIAASTEYPGRRFVTVAMDDVKFHHSVREGTILSIRCERAREGLTSVTYQVSVRDCMHDFGKVIFATRLTLVNVDEHGRKQPVQAP